MYARFIAADGSVVTKFLRLKDVSSANAASLLQALTVAFDERGLSDYNRRLVGFLSDGLSVNFGRKSGLLTLLRQRSPWIIGFHCMNHRL